LERAFISERIRKPLKRLLTVDPVDVEIIIEGEDVVDLFLLRQGFTLFS